MPWDFQTLLSNRPVDVWMHEQDVRRATDRPGGFDCAVADHVLRTFGRGLPMVVGKRVAPPVGTTVRLEVPDAGLGWSVRVGDDGRAAPVDDDIEATTTVALTPRTSWCSPVVAAAHRRREPRITGDEEIGRRLVESLAVTP